MHESKLPPPSESLGWSDIDKMQFPTWFTALIDYFATGEGQTLWIVMARAQSADELRATLERHCGGYFASGAEIWPKLVVPHGRENFMPAAVVRRCKLPEEQIGYFHFSSRFHLNFS